MLNNRVITDQVMHAGGPDADVMWGEGGLDPAPSL